MSTPTITKPLPQHYERTMDDAERINWDVVTTPTSMKLVPPTGKKGSQIVLDLRTPMAPPQLQKKLVDEGFVAALQAWEREQGKQAPEPKAAPAAAQTAPSPEDGKPVLVCSICKANGVPEPYTTTWPQGLGSHKRRTHGVVGTSTKAERRRERTLAAKPPAKKAPAAAKKTAPAKKAAASAAVPAPRSAVQVGKRQEEPIDVSGLPVSVAAPLTDLLNAVRASSGDAQALQTEVEQLRSFRDQVDELVNDGSKPPVKVVSTIMDLVEKTKQK
ncbi:hypothetical protein AB0E08_08220 [Streptomyces sp. NPDC048281]|uniref:hypothetical protein n=1 Tax=Streptomyces sp. NPDC048281 TaxID=3154715 RepID=UPI003434ECCE